MLKVFYQAIDAAGRPREGIMRVMHEDKVREKLEKRGWLVHAMRVVPSRISRFVRRPSHLSRLASLRFAGALAALLKSGMALPRALEVLAMQAKDPSEKQVIEALASHVLRGSSLSEAMASFKSSFDALSIQSIRAGERAGALEPALREVERYGLRQVQVKKRLQRACLYPATVLVIAVVVMTVLLIGVVPRFERVFLDLSQGASLPRMTASVVAVSYFIRAHGLGAFISFISLVAAAFVGIRSVPLQSWFKGLCARLPGLNGLIRSMHIARWARTQGLLMHCGVDVLDAWTASVQVVGVPQLQGELLRARERVRDGESLSRALDIELCCDPALMGFLETGEQTGELADQLTASALYLEDRVESRMQTCLALLEPSLIVTLALMIGCLVVALFLPMTSIIEQLAL